MVGSFILLPRGFEDRMARMVILGLPKSASLLDIVKVPCRLSLAIHTPP